MAAKVDKEMVARVKAIAKLLKKGQTYNFIAKEFGVSSSLVRQINVGTTHGGITGATADNPISPRQQGVGGGNKKVKALEPAW